MRSGNLGRDNAARMTGPRGTIGGDLSRRVFAARANDDRAPGVFERAPV